MANVLDRASLESAAATAEVTLVELPQLGTVGILAITAATFEQYQKLCIAATKKSEKDPGAFVGMKAELLVRCLCDEAGTLLFELDEADKLNDMMSNAAMQFAFDEARRFNGVTDEEMEELESG